MLKKISVVLCAGLFATAFATGCKKDKADGGGAATCDGVAAKLAAQMSEKMHGGADAKDMPPEMAEAMKKIPGAIAQSCKDDKWSQEALDCASKAKDPKKDCDGKLTDEQVDHMKAAAMKAMSGDTAVAGMAKTEEAMAQPVPATGTTDGSADTTMAGSGSGSAAPVAPAAGAFPATCEGVAARAQEDIAKELPPGMPADVPAKFAAMLTKVCTDDKWGPELLECGVTAADPKHDCRSKMTPEQDANLDKAQDEFGAEILKAMGAGTDDGAAPAAGGSSGVAECDAFLDAVDKLAACDKLPADQKAGMSQMRGAFENIKMLPADQRGQVAEQCKQGMEGLEAMAKAYGC